MPVDPYIAQGIAPIGRDLPQIGGMLQARNQANQQNALAQRQQGMLEQKFASQQQSEAVQWLFGATEFALQQKDPVAAARYLLPEAKRRGLVDPSYDGSTLTKDMLGQLNQQAKIMIGGGPQIDPTAKFNAEQRVELEKLRSQNDMTRSQYEAKARAALEEKKQRFEMSQGSLERQARVELAQMQSNIKAQAKQSEKQAEKQTAWKLYEAGMQGLREGLAGTETGPLAGRIPAVTTGQQIAEGGVSAMAPILKQIFRVAGEGVFTDRDQALLLMMVPDRKDTPEARAAKIANIDNIVRAKLGLSEQAESSEGWSIEEVP